MASDNSHLNTFTFYSGIVPDTEDFNDAQNATYEAITRIQSELISEDARPTKIPVLTLSAFTVTIPASSAVSATGISTYWDEAISILATTATKGSLQGSIAPIASRKRYAIIAIFNVEDLSDLQTNDKGGSDYYKVGSSSSLYVYQTATDVILSDDYTVNSELIALIESIRSDDDGVVLAICEIINGATGLLTQDVHPAQLVMFPAGGPNAEVDEVREFFGYDTLATVMSDAGTVSATAFAVSGTPGNIVVAGGETIMLTVPALGDNGEFRKTRTIKTTLPAATFTFALNSESYVVRAKWSDDLNGLEVYLGTGDYPNDPNSLPFAVGTSGGTNLGYRRTLMDLPILSIATGTDGSTPVISHIANNVLSELNYILPIVDNIVVHETDDVQLTNDYSVANRNFTFPNDLDGFLTELTDAINPVLQKGDVANTMDGAYSNIDTGLVTANSIIHVTGDGTQQPWADAWTVDLGAAGYGTPKSVTTDGRYFYIAFDDQKVRAFKEADGTLVWTSSDLGGTGLDEICTDGVSVFVYEGIANTLFRLSVTDGTTTSSATTETPVGMITDGTYLYSGTTDGVIVKRTVALGGDLWSVASSAGMVVTSLALNGTYLAVTTEYHGATTSNLTVYDLADGSVVAQGNVGTGSQDSFSCQFSGDILLVAGNSGLLGVSFDPLSGATSYVLKSSIVADNYTNLSINHRFGIMTNTSVTADIHFFGLGASVSKVTPFTSELAYRSNTYLATSATWDKLLVMGLDVSNARDIRVIQLPIFPTTFRVTSPSELYRFPIVGELMTNHR